MMTWNEGLDLVYSLPFEVSILTDQGLASRRWAGRRYLIQNPEVFTHIGRFQNRAELGPKVLFLQGIARSSV